MYDMKNLAKLKLLDANAPEGMKAFWAFDKAAMAEGAIPVKYKELIALGVGFTTQCPYCIEIHSNRARQAGASGGCRSRRSRGGFARRRRNHSRVTRNEGA
jgi:AhpD family alkylhydroperoxidase